MTSASKLHPNPQLARRDWIDLNGVWDFAFDDDDTGLQDKWPNSAEVFDKKITVPFPPESTASGIHDNHFHPIVWYRREFRIEGKYTSKCLILHFGAVDYQATVWVNGQLVATHEGGQTPFQVDISAQLQPRGQQVIVVRAKDSPTDLTQPRGKQDWQEEPHRIWYYRTTGIWQPVWIEPVSATHIASVKWTPNLDQGSLRVSVTLNRGDGSSLRVRVRLALHDVEVVDDLLTFHGSDVQREIALELGGLTMSREEVLWFPEHPNLIDATLTVLDGDHVVDEVQSYAGLRSVGAAGGRFLLNGRPYYLRMALEQGYWPDTHLASPGEEALRREVELAKELGFNGLRIHQKVEDPRFLYWCDRLGMLVWGEIGNAYVFSPSSIHRLTREWLEVIDRDYSHPCIIAWVPLNESWGVPNLLRDPAQQDYLQALYHLTKSLDTTRPVIANDGWEYLRGDVFGIHDYTFHGQILLERYGSAEAVERTLRDVQPQHRFITLSGQRAEGIPVMLTEFGGISYRPQPGSRWFGYGTVSDQDSFREKYQELVDAVLGCPTLAGFCYTQLTDTCQETNGLLTANREPKLDPAVVRAINSRASMSVPGDVIAQMRKVTGTSFGGAELETEAW